MDSIRTIKSESTSLFKDKGSKHYGFVFPVSSEDEIKYLLDNLRKNHTSANHVCYAYVLGKEKDYYRFNDDGEPSNSAGKPIYGQIVAFDLTNILVAVVRYFGGTKLGVGGLINAYRTTAKLAIENAVIFEKQITKKVKLTFKYSELNTVMKLLKVNQIQPLDQKFETECEIFIEVIPSQISLVQNIFKPYNNIDVILSDD